MPATRKPKRNHEDLESDRESSPEPNKNRTSRGSICGTVNFEEQLKDGKIRVKCNQSGEIYKPQITALSNEEGDYLTAHDLVPGSQLIMEFKKKAYPVTVLKDTSDDTDGGHNKRKKKRVGKEPSKPALSEIINNAKHLFEENSENSDDSSGSTEILYTQKSPILSSHQNTPHSRLCTTEQDMMRGSSHQSTPRQPAPSRMRTNEQDMMRVLIKIQSTLDVLVEAVTGGAAASAVKKEDPNFIVNGVNLLQIPAKDPYSYGRCLLDTLFSKEELGMSVIFKTKKSKRPALSPDRVEKLFDCINIKFKEYDHKKMHVTLGQKCRDSGRCMIVEDMDADK